MPIKVLLVLGLILIPVWVFKRKSSIHINAIGKLGFVIIIAAGIIAVLYPETLNTLANNLGVGRGADLLLYLLVIAFLFQTVLYREKIAKLERKINKLARAQALDGAKKQKGR